MISTSKSSPLVELEGDSYEMGEQYGRLCRATIRGALATNSRITEFYTGLTREQCARRVKRFLPYLEDEVPQLCAEMKGVADGSGVGYDDILAFHFHSRDLSGVGGCTMVHIGRESERGASSITGQTIDWTPSLERFYHVVVRRPRKGLDTIQYTLAGLIGLVGKNEKGTSTFMNILLTSERIAVGVPAYLMLRLLMEQPSLEAALATLRGKKRTGPFNFMVAGDRGAFNVEASATHVLATSISGRNYVHTNHCLREPMATKDQYAKIVGSDETHQRYDRMKRLLADRDAKDFADVGAVFSLLKDHENLPDSICRHARTSVAADGKMKTIAAVLMRTKESGIWVARGNPCQSHPQFFAL